MTVRVAVALAVAAAATAAPAQAASLKVLSPRPGEVFVARTVAAAHALRLTATLTIPRGATGLGVRLNGHRLRLPAPRGRVRIRLDRAHGLVVGPNLLWATHNGRDGDPTVHFNVGYRSGALGLRMRLGKGRLPAALATLRAPKRGIMRLAAWVNGSRIPVTRRTRVLDLAQLGTVHRGRNRLRVRMLMTNGRVAIRSRTFRLDRRRNIAVARLRGPAVVGGTATLDSSRSRGARGARLVKGVRWVLLRRPRLSRARLSRADGARTALRPDVPGRYFVGLITGRGSRRGYDVAELSATYSNPLVPLDTIEHAGDGTPGIQVGGHFYADPGAAPIQVLALDRSNLGDTDYGTHGVQPTDDFASLAATLQGLPATDLVMVTHPAGTGALPAGSLANLDTALRKIGGTLPQKWTLSQGDCWSGATDACLSGTNNSVAAGWSSSGIDGGSFTVIGVPGLQPGQAWRATAMQTGAQDGRISGYLTRGTDGGSVSDYAVINGGADHYQAVDTCAPPSCDVQVGFTGNPGTATYAATGSSGFQVVVLDRTTLSPIVNRTVTTPADLLAAITGPGGQQSTGHFSGAMDDQRLVIVRSLKNGALTGAPTTQLLKAIDQLGGTPDLLADAISGRFAYSLVGAATNLPWRNASALESSTEVPTTPPPDPSKPGATAAETGRISGVVGRDRYGLYAPVGGDPVADDGSNVDLYRIMYEPPTPFPYAADPALPYIANALGLSTTPDVRSAYTNTALPWDSLNTELAGLTCNAPTLCGPNFEVVKAQLEKEFRWVPTVYALKKNLLDPYTEGGENGFDVQKVYTDVKSSVPLKDTSPVDMGWLGIITNLMKLATAALNKVGLPELAAGTQLAGAAGELSTDVMQTEPDGAPADRLSASATDLASSLNDQVISYETWVNSQLVPTLLGDYGKLKTVGTGVGGDPQWDWTGDTTTAVITALRGNTRASAYSALLPHAWQGYDLKVAPFGAAQTSNDVTTYACDWFDDGKDDHQYPFHDATPQNQFWWSPLPPVLAGTQYQAITNYTSGARVDEAWTFANLTPANWSPYNDGSGPRTAQLPDANTDVTHYIYGKDSADPNNGAYQFGPIWWRNTYNPPSHTLCFKSYGKSSWFSTQYGPPNITPQP